jgi:hypothetical protein
MTRRPLTAQILALFLLLVPLGGAGCGVSSQDKPQPIEETSPQQPPATPSVATQPAPEPTSTTSPPAASIPPQSQPRTP